MAEALPFDDSHFDAALAVLTVHHWTDAKRGLAELRRVACRQVIFTWDPKHLGRFWFTRDYLPEAVALDAGFTTLEPTWRSSAPPRSNPSRFPTICQDGFFAAYWRRPEAYFDPDVRAGISGFGILEQSLVERALQLLADDLAIGRAGHRRNEAPARARRDRPRLPRSLAAGSDQKLKSTATSPRSRGSCRSSRPTWLASVPWIWSSSSRVAAAIASASSSAAASRASMPSAMIRSASSTSAVDHLGLGHDAHDLALHEQVALAAAGGDAEVGFARLARSVHDAAHDRDLERDVARPRARPARRWRRGSRRPRRARTTGTR